MNKIVKVFVFILVPIAYLLMPVPAKAVCPICTVAVGAGLGLSRYLGIDDAVSSIWIGGLILSSSFWLIDWLKKKDFKVMKQFNNIAKQYSNLIIVILMYTLVLIPLWFSHIIGHPFNTILGIDKIVFGTAIGSLAFLTGMWADRKLRKIKGKQLFNFQKVVFPVLSLVITSLFMYFYGGYLYDR
ncbi:hypothetical protein A3D00_02735 [Candidatus Woesebacteria bacterium RIFCSPHIGHO2_02_FULL_38_9]|uniref:Uncharacterized protein n=1 Tax=Candidatus Woesebacteria bacterium RIFCSPHIGHO2_01_FULL_39_28 TaxID=1802496 RepID=A0A1F7YFH8_9BACT|nr:MAG: hypothetical protein A2627_04325 [Candidatus Woesebacteria bacterium RIFCSPHIGHO2_01_FULL_39_28]OGM35166.1 MAG: hypothetical protein A3D00_02735 [Candidatus Woesebacteria bacterium RIFCSPHIGHO2_02_FULL_38_9]OGM57756.1 MAG: hypothetical protein A3A50_05585 [Candidatus Woesebacteria bacterium RIFCSPLOWO2_01_FULL_38_20]